MAASTSWTGAYAGAAGATDVQVVAPADFQHPPDYEPKPSDLLALRDAEFVPVGGTERFVGRIKEAAGGHPRLIEVQLGRVVATFPNEPLSPQQVADVAAAKPDLVFDNSNVPGAAAAAEQAGAEHVLLTNLPGRDLDLVALFEANAARMRDALSRRASR